MNWKIFVAVIFAIGATVAALTVLRSDTTPKTQSAQQISTEQKAFAQVQTAVANGGQLIDVRTPEEFTAGRIKEAINLPLTDIQAGKYPEIDKTKPLYLYCRSGNRSAQATTILRNAGYTNITDLGAMTEVADMGGEIIQ